MAELGHGYRMPSIAYQERSRAEVIGGDQLTRSRFSVVTYQRCAHSLAALWPRSFWLSFVLAFVD